MTRTFPQLVTMDYRNLSSDFTSFSSFLIFRKAIKYPIAIAKGKIEKRASVGLISLFICEM